MYEITLDNQTVGWAKVTVQGLYYKMECCCNLDKHQLGRVIVTCNGNEVDLGLCVPMGKQFGVNTRIPIKRLGNGEMCFEIRQNTTAKTQCFIPIVENERFLYLQYLNKAFLCCRNGQLGIILENGIIPDPPAAGFDG